MRLSRWKYDGDAISHYTTSYSSEERECSKNVGKRIRKTWETILYSAARNEKQRRRFFFFPIRVPFKGTSLPLIACSWTRGSTRVSSQVARERRDLTRKTEASLNLLFVKRTVLRNYPASCRVFRDTSGWTVVTATRRNHDHYVRSSQMSASYGSLISELRAPFSLFLWSWNYFDKECGNETVRSTVS